MDAYHNLAVSYDRLTNDVDYEATVEFYNAILKREGLQPRTAVDLACGTGVLCRILRERGIVEHLPKKLYQALIAREENPEASLSELAAMMEPPITKPAMNHRLQKLIQLAQEA